MQFQFFCAYQNSYNGGLFNPWKLKISRFQLEEQIPVGANIIIEPVALYLSCLETFLSALFHAGTFSFAFFPLSDWLIKTKRFFK